MYRYSAVWVGVLSSAFLMQVVVILLFGIDGHNVVFRLEREHWYRVWTPFTSSLAHGGPIHLSANLLGLLFFGCPIAATVGWRWSAGTVYIAAVMGQLMGVVSGKDELIGASAGVTAATSWALLASPFWLSTAFRFVRSQARDVRSRMGPRDWSGAYFQTLPIVAIGIHFVLFPILAGTQLASDVRGAVEFSTYPWGLAPAGTAHTAHVFGYVIGVIFGVSHFLWELTDWGAGEVP